MNNNLTFQIVCEIGMEGPTLCDRNHISTIQFSLHLFSLHIPTTHSGSLIYIKENVTNLHQLNS